MSVGTSILLLLCAQLQAPIASSATASPSPPEWNWESKPDGFQISVEPSTNLRRLGSFPWQWKGLPIYWFRVADAAATDRFQFWLKRLGDEPTLLSAGMQLAVCRGDGFLRALTDGVESAPLELSSDGSFVRGEPLEFCLHSQDGTKTAFAEVVPFPIEAKDEKGNHLSMVLRDQLSYAVVAKMPGTAGEGRLFCDEGDFLLVDGETVPADVGIGFQGETPQDGEPLVLVTMWLSRWPSVGGASTLRLETDQGGVSVDFEWGMEIYAPRNKAISLYASAYRSYELQHYEQAIKVLKDAVKTDSSYVQAHVLLGMLLQIHEKDYRGAESAFSTAIDADPSCHLAYRNRGVTRITYPNLDARDAEGAIADLTQACQLTDWENAEYISQLAFVCAESGDFEAAVRWQEKALEIAGDDESEQAGEWLSRLETYRQNRSLDD